MKNNNYITPLYKLYNDNFQNQIFIKRDDLIPLSFGGNKVRIAQEFINDLIYKKKNCLIGYGNPKSNLSRALSSLCFKNKIECHIVCPIDNNSPEKTYNKELATICNTKFHICKKSEVSKTIENVMNECKKNNLSPYYINGNIYGKGNESTPVNAYFHAYKEINDYQIQNDLIFDYIFLPVGTGMTQAGLLCGIQKFKANTQIIGISIAREKNIETQILKEYVDSFCKKTGLLEISKSQIIVDSSYLCGGYGIYNSKIEEIILNIYKSFGIPLDPTYSGKAFYGMTKYLIFNQLKNKKILFLHTGGTPLFFDYLNYKKE